MSGTETVQQIKSKRNVYLALSTLVLLFLGLIYAFSMFAKPMTTDFNLAGNVSLTFNIMMIMFCLGGLFGSLLERVIGVRGCLFLCAGLFAIGFCGAGLLGEVLGDVVVLYLFYGVIGGTGVGIGYTIIISITNLWFPDKVGFSSGVLMMGFGLSSLIFGNLALMLRPIVGGMGMVLTIIGIVVAVLVAILAFTLTRPSMETIELLAPNRKVVKQDQKETDDVIFKTPIFYMMYVWAIILVTIGLATIGNAASDAVQVGLTESFASLLVGLISACNGLARIFIGLLYDKAGIKITMFVNAAIALSSTVLILAAFALAEPLLYVPGALLCGISYGGNPVTTSAFTRQRYGASKYPFNLSIINLGIAFGSLANIIITAVVGADGRMYTFVILLVMAIIAVLDVFVFGRRWNKDMGKAQ